MSTAARMTSEALARTRLVGSRKAIEPRLAMATCLDWTCPACMLLLCSAPIAMPCTMPKATDRCCGLNTAKVQ